MNRLTTFFKKQKDQKQDLVKKSSDKSLSFGNDSRIENVEPKKGIVITFTNSTFGGRQKSDKCTKPKESTDKFDTFNSPDKMSSTSSISASS